MRAQFFKENTGLTVADTEAGVKGTYRAPGGASYKFFGCDALNIKP